jgi:hypothetical protein
VSRMRLSASETALIATIYDPPRATRSWMLKDVLPAGATRYYSLARWALVDALRICGVGAGDNVLLPELICREVLAAVYVLGATTVFYPVSRQLSPSCSAEDMAEAKAILAVNYFGFPQELRVFREYCHRTGAALIEDNAHGFLSRDTNGELLGSRGDAGLFSFRKTIAVPDGSALVLNDDRTMLQASEVLAPSGVGVRYQVKQSFRRVVRHIGPVRTLGAIGAIRQLRQLCTGDAVPPGAADAETRIPIPPRPCALVGRPISVADPEPEAERRRALYGLAGQFAEQVGAVPVFPRLPANVVPYGFPMFVSPAQVPRVTAEVGRFGLQLSQWPDLPGAVAPSAQEHYRALIVLPFLW